MLRAAKVVASDETGVRIEGTNSYHWVFHCNDAVVHQPDYSRAARVVDDMMDGHEPKVWIRTAIPRSKSMASCIRRVLLIWPATRHSRFSMAPRFALPVQALAWQGVRPRPNHQGFRRLDDREENENWKSSSKSLWPRQPDATSPGNCKPKSGARDQLLTFCDYPGQVDPTNTSSANSARA